MRTRILGEGPRAAELLDRYGAKQSCIFQNALRSHLAVMLVPPHPARAYVYRLIREAAVLGLGPLHDAIYYVWPGAASQSDTSLSSTNALAGRNDIASCLGFLMNELRHRLSSTRHPPKSNPHFPHPDCTNCQNWQRGARILNSGCYVNVYILRSFLQLAAMHNGPKVESQDRTTYRTCLPAGCSSYPRTK